MKQLIILCGLVIILFSCKKDNDLIDSTINAKWIVTGNEMALYKSFEFTKSGDYFIITGTVEKSVKEQNFIHGKYVKNGNSIELENFGKLTLNILSETNLSFKLQNASTNAVIEITANKATEMSSDSKTEMLCQKWQVVMVNDEPIEAGDEWDLTALFSKAGTYFIEYNNPEESDNGGLALWQWRDADHTYFCYSWDGEITCNENHQVKIIELTQNSMKIEERTASETNGPDLIDVYDLIPVSVTKSTIIIDKCSSTKRSIRKSFLLKY